MKIKLHQEAWDQTFQLMSWWKKDKIKAARIMVAGAGALGNEVLKNLALLGIGHIVLVDFDRIEYSNLCRSVLFRATDSAQNRLKAEVAAERIKSINPEVKLKTINGDVTIDIGLGVFRRMDAIIGCLDNRLARLALNRYSFWMGKTWIDGAIENLAGQLNVYQPGISCYESGLTPQDWQNIKQKLGCPDIARRNASFGRVPTTPISSSIIAAMQVQEALKVVHGNTGKLLSGKTFYYEGMNNECFTFDTTPPREDALSNYYYDPVIEARELTSESSISDLLEWAADRFEDQHPVIRLDHRLIRAIIPSKQKKRIPLTIAFPHLSESITEKYKIDPDEEIIIRQDDTVNHIDKDFDEKNRCLREIGIPPLHVIRIFANNEDHFVELTGDENYLTFK